MAGRQVVLKNCRYVVANPSTVLEDVDILVEDGRIVSVERGLGGGDEIDCREKIVIPGLVNAHTHSAMWVFRGLFDEGELFEWLGTVQKAEEKLTREVVYWASMAALLEMVMGGTTAVVDMYFYPFETVRAARQLGVRIYTGPIVSGASDDEDRKRAFRIAERISGEGASDHMVGLVVNVHAVYSSTREDFEIAVDLAKRFGSLLVTHASETRDEVFYAKNRYGKFPIEYLYELGFLGEKTGLAHLGWITSWEISRLKETGATAIHCPTSNMKLATGGFIPLQEMARGGINVALGTDGAASNNSLDMFREMKAAVLLNRHSYWNTELGAGAVFRMATLNGYSFIGLRGGAISAGYVADLVVLDGKSVRLNPLTRRNVVSNVVYSATGADVEKVLVGGRLVYDRDEKERFAAMLDEIMENLRGFVESI